MEQSDRIVLNMIETFYPEWVEREKKRYPNAEGYEKYKQIILNTFGYDIERAAMEQERGTDFGELERRLQLMKLSQELKEEEKQKKKKKKGQG